MYTRRRNLLHKSKLDEFVEWAKTKGYVVGLMPSKAVFEVLRLNRGAEPPVIFWDRINGDHYTSQGVGTQLVQQWLIERKQNGQC